MLLLWRHHFDFFPGLLFNFFFYFIINFHKFVEIHVLYCLFRFFFFFLAHFPYDVMVRVRRRRLTLHITFIIYCATQKQFSFLKFPVDPFDNLSNFFRRTYYMHIYHLRVFENRTISKWLQWTRVGIYILGFVLNILLL